METKNTTQTETKIKYFTLEEMYKSQTASKLHINNTPDTETTLHLIELMKFLDPIREKWGSAIRVTSGYRCDRLNRIVKGSVNSAHKYGWAVDLVPKKGTVEELFSFIAQYLILSKLKWDQLIIERSKTGSWVHLGLKNKDGKQRGQVFTLNV